MSVEQRVLGRAAYRGDHARKQLGAGVCVCLVGLSPAVVTETLHGLVNLADPPVVPERVVIVTTAEGRRRAVSRLIGDGGALDRFRRDYELSESLLVCSEEDIFVLSDGAGRPIEDVRTSADMEIAASSIARVLRLVRGRSNGPLHCSFAGARKSLGVLLALALQLEGHPGDRLYHVLVSEPFERIPDFFYPPPSDETFEIEGRRVSTSEARIDLASIPVIRLGDLLRVLGVDATGVHERAAAVETALRGKAVGPALEIVLASREVRFDGRSITLPAQQLAVLLLYASLRAECAGCSVDGHPACPRCHLSDDEIFSHLRGQLLAHYRSVRRTLAPRTSEILEAHGESATERAEFDRWIQQTRSRVNRNLRDLWSSGESQAPCWIVRDETARPRRRGLVLPPRSVRIYDELGRSDTVDDLKMAGESSLILADEHVVRDRIPKEVEKTKDHGGSQ